MILLTIEDFSCIRSARFELAPVTVLIGPQGSGKSVTTKLFYFCVDALSRQYVSAERGIDFDEFKRDTARLFKSWFPPSAWGRRRFNISFQAGNFSIRFLRRMTRGNPSDEVAVTFSDFFKVQYEELLSSYERLKTNDLDEEALVRRSESGWRIRDQSIAKLSKELGSDFLESQIFIPAGRAYFTSIGRIVAAFEQASLDPVTIKFAKIFANLRDFASRRLYSRQNRERQVERDAVMDKLFGGKIKFENDQEFVETIDGRIVPFTALSSGQQELLPMWLLLDFYADRAVRSENSGDLFYIEEPEAHLFPAAQSLLMDFLIGQLVSKKDKRSLILTTHSPYILAKINNYLKAGSIGRIRKNSIAVNSVVPKECWLTPSRVKAYAIHDGSLIDIIDDDGMVDASYIDSVSDEVSRTFGNLLDIEFPED